MGKGGYKTFEVKVLQAPIRNMFISMEQNIKATVSMMSANINSSFHIEIAYDPDKKQGSFNLYYIDIEGESMSKLFEYDPHYNSLVEIIEEIF